MRRPLYETASVVLNGSGIGVAKVGPLTVRETWYPSAAAVSVTYPVGVPPTNEAQCSIYVGEGIGSNPPNQNGFRDLTFTGSSGDSSGKISADTVRKNEFIWAVWSGGDAGKTATLTVTGEKDV